MTAKQVQAATASTTKNAEIFLPYILATCEKYEINTPIRQLCFLAQVGHESGGLYYTSEIASGEAYEGRKDLGNTQPGDGKKFKGRGLIQITGRANYTSLGAAFGIDLLTDPTLLGASNINHCSFKQLRYAALSAGWYWNSRALNKLADGINIAVSIKEGKNYDLFVSITRKINGGTNGLADRIKRYEAGAKHFQKGQ